MTSTPPAPAPTPAETDLLLVERTVAGDQKAFELLASNTSGVLNGSSGGWSATWIWSKTLRRRPSSAPTACISSGATRGYTWLYRIAVNTAKKALVDLKRDPVVFESTLMRSSDDEDETPAHGRELISDETPDTVLAAGEIAATVNAAMDALPEELRQAVTLREIDGLSYEEIAEVMNCPIGTVRSRIFRAREAISVRVKPLLDKQSGKRW